MAIVIWIHLHLSNLDGVALLLLVPASNQLLLHAVMRLVHLALYLLVGVDEIDHDINPAVRINRVLVAHPHWRGELIIQDSRRVQVTLNHWFSNSATLLLVSRLPLGNSGRGSASARATHLEDRYIAAHYLLILV